MRSSVEGFSNAKLDLRRSELDKNRFIETSDVSADVYICALLPELLPEVERIIWIDGDTIIERDIAQLWNVELGDCVVGMVPDYSIEDIESKKKAMGMIGYTYYNTGVALMDLSALRSLNISQAIKENNVELHRKVREAGLNWYPNQDVMNHALRGKVKTLAFKYNSYFWQSLPLGETPAACVEAYLRPVIVHYIGNPKPNKLGCIPVNSPDWKRYYKYTALTPFARSCDAEKVARYKQRENNTMNGLMIYERRQFTWYFAPSFFKRTVEVCAGVISEREISIWGINDFTWNLITYLSVHGINVKHVVDGVPANQDAKIFEILVESPDILKNSANDMFVLLDMRSIKISESVMSVLRDWNYADRDYYYVYGAIPDGG
jgi:lipopolysaccharide biosynthesis glycosyltransferase